MGTIPWMAYVKQQISPASFSENLLWTLTGQKCFNAYQCHCHASHQRVEVSKILSGFTETEADQKEHGRNKMSKWRI